MITVLRFQLLHYNGKIGEEVWLIKTRPVIVLFFLFILYRFLLFVHRMCNFIVWH